MNTNATAQMVTSGGKGCRKDRSKKQHSEQLDDNVDRRVTERQLVEWCEVHAPTRAEPIKCCPCCEAVNERQRLLAEKEKTRVLGNMTDGFRQQLLECQKKLELYEGVLTLL